VKPVESIHFFTDSSDGGHYAEVLFIGNEEGSWCSKGTTAAGRLCREKMELFFGCEANGNDIILTIRVTPSIHSLPVLFYPDRQDTIWALHNGVVHEVGMDSDVFTHLIGPGWWWRAQVRYVRERDMPALMPLINHNMENGDKGFILHIECDEVID
jgi:hypothetical protein